MVARLLNGRATDLPIDLVNAAMDADSPQAFARQLGIDTALGLGTDIGIEAIGKLWRMGKSAAQKRLGNHSGGYVPLGTEDLTDYLNTGKKQSTRNEKRRMVARGESPILTSNAEVEDFITKSITGEQQQAIKAYGKAGDRL